MFHLILVLQKLYYVSWSFHNGCRPQLVIPREHSVFSRLRRWNGGWRDGYPVQEHHGNIRRCCVFLHNKCPSTRQSHLKRAIRLSFSFAKRLRLYQWGHDEFSTDIHSVWALSEHAFKWSLSASASYYTRTSKLSLLSSTTSNTITTAVLAPLHPAPSLFYLLFK